MAEAIAPAELPTIFDASTCVRKGMCPVMALQGQEKTAMQSHSIYFEQHGTGPEKVVFIMGLNTSSFGWIYQVKHFAQTHSVLVMDNRGVGNSDTPKGPYTTSALSEDILTLLEYVGWNNGRELHIVGISLGGMIAQELALRIPERILSLTLVVTKAGSAGLVSNLTPWKGISSLVWLTFTTDDSKKMDIVLPMLYPEEWLDAKSTLPNAKGRTNREVVREGLAYRIKNTRKQTLAGSIAQTAAARSHHVTSDRLHKLGQSIPKIWIVTGDVDHLVKPVNSEFLHQHMPQAEYQVWKGVGHGIIGQEPEKFNKNLERVIREGREIGSKAPWV
ncbi:related to alpha/beta hydrolase [Serendipita indica DSM 11827]|uniref:Related to alpha/beta hydrolase n=1 Tax=Serendipita indica (strain DSM 11827) TaxID=1109443 RepID=G4T870_SERID|nr:related to alpha/beta hydrolase [Serendipita indica DSM 11827]